MEIAISTSNNSSKNTMPELMALKLYHSAKEVQATSPNIKIKIERADT